MQLTATVYPGGTSRARTERKLENVVRMHATSLVYCFVGTRGRSCWTPKEMYSEEEEAEEMTASRFDS